MRKVLFLSLTITIATIIIGGSLFILWALYMPPASPETAEAVFTIKFGEPLVDIARNLEKENLIRSSLAFLVYTRLTNQDTAIKAGRFRLQHNNSMPALVRELTNPKTAEITVTFPEGITITEMDKKLVELDIAAMDDFIACTTTCDFSEFTFISDNPHKLEGFLFPDTYFVNITGYTPLELITRMLRNFQSKFTDEMQKTIEKNSRTLYEVITMASIIEKEVRTDADYAVVAGILWKRFDNDWPLGADATLLYGKENREIDYEDLQKDSPYNTRKRLGLPKTPIGNPGLKAITAAVYPEDSEYWFYLTAKDGRVIYARTNQEHDQNKRKYLY